MAFNKIKEFFKGIKEKIGGWFNRVRLDEAQSVFMENIQLPIDLALQAYKLTFGYNSPIDTTLDLLEHLYHLRPDLKWHLLPAFSQAYPVHWLKLDRNHARQVMQQWDFDARDWRIGFRAFVRSAMSNERARERFMDFTAQMGVECMPFQGDTFANFMYNVLKIV